MSYTKGQKNPAEILNTAAPAPTSVASGPAPQMQAMTAMAGTPSRVVGKTRNPWGVWLLGLTIVYPLIWYFKINKEHCVTSTRASTCSQEQPFSPSRSA
jgi:hypothetical protein